MQGQSVLEVSLKNAAQGNEVQLTSDRQGFRLGCSICLGALDESCALWAELRRVSCSPEGG